MPADPIHPHQLDGAARFRADLTAYLDSLSVGELAELLGELPRSRQEPLGLGVLMIALNERLPDAYRLLPAAGHPGPGEGRRRSLRQVVADRRAARTSRHAGLSPSELAEWLADRQRQAEQHADRRRAGAVAERRVAEALRTPPTDPNPAAGRQEPGRPSRPTGSATANPRTGRCPNRRHAPNLGCRWAATTRSTISRRTGRAAGTARSATTTGRTADPGLLLFPR
jgi:hypothetical protein